MTVKGRFSNLKVLQAKLSEMTEVQIEWKKLATCNKIDDKKAELVSCVVWSFISILNLIWQFEVVKLLQEELSFCVDWFLVSFSDLQ